MSEQIAAVFEVPTPDASKFAAAPEHLRTADKTGKSVLDRFLAKIDVGMDGCWRWRGATAGGNREWDVGGPYGRISVFGKLWYTHRFVLILADRFPPSSRHVPHHMCRVRLCCNPDHLIWVTVEENARLSNECSGPIPF